MRILDIIRGTTVDGPGFRTAIYMAGCPHNCPGCHNPGSHDPNGGTEMTVGEIAKIIEEEDFDVTLSGGDPFMHPEEAAAIADAAHKLGHTVWCYTGYTIEQIKADSRLSGLLTHIDVLVDGPFVQSLHNPDLLFRGSSNQRIIYLKQESANQ